MGGTYLGVGDMTVVRPTVRREDRAAVLDAACSRLTATVAVYGVSARPRSQTPLGE